MTHLYDALNPDELKDCIENCDWKLENASTVAIWHKGERQTRVTGRTLCAAYRTLKCA